MAIDAPFALLGLLALPVIVWLHRRRRRPVPVDVPSLMFLEGEPAETFVPERVRLDAELLLSLLAAALLAAAAAGPSARPLAPGRTVRVVVNAGPSMAAKDAAGERASERAEAAVSAIAGALVGGDRLVRVDSSGLRDDLVAKARAADGSLRVVVTDRALADPPGDFRYVLVGSPRGHNVGIVAADVLDGGGTTRVFVNAWNDGPTSERVEVSLAADGAEVARRAIEIPASSARSVTFERPPPLPRTLLVRLSPSDDLAADDEVRLDRSPLRVGFAPEPLGYAAPYREAVLAGLSAVLPAGGIEIDAATPEVWVGPAGAAPKGTRVVLVLHAVAGAAAGGTDGVRPPPGAAFETLDATYGRDLDPSGCDLVYARAPAPGSPWPLVRVSREPEVGRDLVEWVPDPLAGHPAPVAHAVWPIFLDDVVRALRGREGPSGFRAIGLLDVEATRLGRDVVPFDPAWLAAAKPDAAPPARPLRTPLLVAGVLCCLALWMKSPLHRSRGAA